MYSYVFLLLCLAILELCRRCCLVLLVAFTGPISKVPGPLLMKFSTLPWVIENIRGNTMNAAPKLFQKYGDAVRVGPHVVLFAGKSAIQKIVVEDDLIKSPDYEWIRSDPEITNLITERDKVAYRQKRRLLSPGFSIGYLNGLEPLMQQCIQAFVQVLDSRCADAKGPAIVNIFSLLDKLTFDVMSATSFGGSFDSVRSSNTHFKSLFLKHLKESALVASFTFLKWLPFVKLNTVAQLDKITDDIISKRHGAGGQARKDLLQIILDAHKADPNSFSEKHVKEEMRLFMIAGSDTTGTSASFMVLLLVNNPEKLRALNDEIDAAFPSKDDPITFANTQDLPYLNAVINESLRVMPIVSSGIPRITTETIMLDNYEIPPGTVVAAWVSAMLKDPRIWPDAEEFVPERWLKEYKGVEVDRKAFIPFSAGSRSCIGQQFALREMRLILATLLRRFKLRLVPGQSHEMRIHVVPYLKSGEYLVEIDPRD